MSVSLPFQCVLIDQAHERSSTFSVLLYMFGVVEFTK